MSTITNTTGVQYPDGTIQISAVNANVSTTYTATQRFLGSTSNTAIVLKSAREPANVSSIAATGTINYDVTNQSVIYFNSNASANWIVNFRGSSSTTLDSLMSVGDIVTTTFAVQQGSTAYYNTSVTVDTSATVTTKWMGGAPTFGNPSGIDVYTYAIIKTATSTFTVLASMVQYK